MAHLAALSITNEEILSDSKNAPDGCPDHDSDKLETTGSDLSFEGKLGGLKVHNEDLSTDDDLSQEHNDEFTSIIPGGVRLPVFQNLSQGKEIESVISTEASQGESEPGFDQGLLKTLHLDEQQDSWSASSVEQQLLI